MATLTTAHHKTNPATHPLTGNWRPLKIGGVTLGFPVVQAALSGYSDWPMRLLARRFGASYSLCEVMLDQFLVSLRERQRNRHFLYNSAEEQPVAGQLMGAEPEQFAQGAQKLVEAGFAVIDINFGCPVRKVVGRCRGGYHLSQPEVALEIVHRTRDIVPSEVPVTLKMRRGMDDTTESRDNFYQILDGAFAYGISAITVHGRTVEQKYKGPSRWEFLREVKQHVGDRTILGSGDLFTAADCWRMIEQTGIDGVTVARGCIGNPWIFAQTRALADGQPLPAPPSTHEQAEVMKEHWDLAEQLYGTERVGVMMRKFGIKYSASHPEYIAVRTDFAKIKDRADWYAVLEKHYSEERPGVYPPPEVHRVQGSTCADSCEEGE
jgi:tRNA-dihydrouridine synthase B